MQFNNLRYLQWLYSLDIPSTWEHVYKLLLLLSGYTARTLFRLLEEKNFGVPWPQTAISLQQVQDLLTSPVGCSVVLEALRRRPAEMFSFPEK